MRGIIEDIRTANKLGTTYYYIKLEGNENYYVLSVLENEEVVLLNKGNEINIEVVGTRYNLIVPAILNN